MPTLVVKYPDGSLSFPLEEGVPVFIGRAKECDIQLPSPAVSRKHAVIMYKSGVCGVKDLDSFNGTVVNDTVITKPHHLTDSDVVKISTFSIRLQSVDVDIRHAGSDIPLTPGNSRDNTIIAGPQPSRPNALSEAMTDRVYKVPARSSTQATSRKSADEAPAEATIELAEPAAYAASLAAKAQDALEAMLPDVPAKESGTSVTPADTDYFRTPGAEHEMDFCTDTVSDFMAEDISFAPVSPKSERRRREIDGETVIPLEESLPMLTLGAGAEDDATTIALNALVADVPARSPAFQHHPHCPVDPESEEAGPGARQPDPDETVHFESGEDPYETNGLPFARDDFDQVPESVYDDWLTGARADTGGGKAAVSDDFIIPPTLMSAISARLALYSQLQDLSEQRKLYRMGNPDLPSNVSAELRRQDEELDNLPFSDEAERLIIAARARHEQFDDEVEEAAFTGSVPERPEIRGAEQMAISQWRLIIEYNEEALPAVLKEAYRLAANEELTQELAEARINHGRLMGGAMYLLALETLAEASRTGTTGVSTRVMTPSLSEEKPKGILGKLGQMIRQRPDAPGEAPAAAPAPKKTETTSAYPRIKTDVLAREFNYVEKNLIRDFNQVYRHAAVHFTVNDDMPLAVRAFLRYGVISLGPRWMSSAARKFVLRDCSENVLQSFEVGPELTNILYADEYLASVANMECASFPDDNLGGQEKSAVERKADRAYRRIVNSRTYNIMMEDMLQSLDLRLNELQAKSDEIDAAVAEAEAKPFMAKGKLLEMQNEQQIISIRRTNMEKNIKRIEKEVVASILESVEEAEGRFRRGELRMPGARSLLWREAASIADLARRMAGSRQRFAPIAFREHFSPGTEMVNDREAVLRSIRDIEQRDPGIFLSMILPAKKKINRISLRLSPVIVVLPGAGLRGLCAMGRDGMESGHLALPLCFAREGIRERQYACLMADFRWQTSLRMAGRDVMGSDTLAGAFTKIRWEFRNEAKPKREKAMIINELSDEKNWRRIYELYLSDAMSGARQLFQRNPKCYNAFIESYIDLPEGVARLR